MSLIDYYCQNVTGKEDKMGEALYWIGMLCKDGQIAISQNLDLEATRCWLKNEIESRFIRIEEESEKEKE